MFVNSCCWFEFCNYICALSMFSPWKIFPWLFDLLVWLSVNVSCSRGSSGKGIIHIPFNFVSDKGFYQIDAGIEYCIKILQSFKSKETDMKDITMITPYNKDVDVYTCNADYGIGVIFKRPNNISVPSYLS